MKKTKKERKKKNKTPTKSKPKQQNDNRNIYINNYTEYKWTKWVKQKAWTG